MATWSLYRSIEASLYDFITTQAISDSLTDIAGNSINFAVGRKNKNSPSLPLITLYWDSDPTHDITFIGSFTRFGPHTLIIDIYALTETDRLDLTKWVVDTINNGWTYYSYADSANPDSPTKTESGRINVQAFLENTRVNLGQTIDETDAHRHRISISVRKEG
ncbi:MAG: hypothetical protein ACTSWG_13495 [Candidatus Helarchaeota archaeon]